MNPSVVAQGALRWAVAVDAPGESVDDGVRGDVLVHGAVQQVSRVVNETMKDFDGVPVG